MKTTSANQEVVQNSEENKIRRGVPVVNGVYVKGTVNKLDVIYTIDTGASCSIISSQFYDQL